jgi:GNAT superfamily N-acetyltransferase
MKNYDVVIQNIHPAHAKDLEQLQRDCFPTLSDNELMREEHFLNHCELFPDGNFVAFAEGRIVGLGSGFLIDFDFDDSQHTFQEIIDEGFYTHHQDDGDWYYGGDISVHPDFRRRGIGSRLYDARKNIVKTLNRKGIVAGGLIPDYADYKDALSPREYVDKVVNDELFDSTLTFQLRRGFTVRGLLKDYIEDEASDNWATLIVWENTDYKLEQD